MRYGKSRASYHGMTNTTQYDGMTIHNLEEMVSRAIERSNVQVINSVNDGEGIEYAESLDEYERRQRG